MAPECKPKLRLWTSGAVVKWLALVLSCVAAVLTADNLLPGSRDCREVGECTQQQLTAKAQDLIFPYNSVHLMYLQLNWIWAKLSFKILYLCLSIEDLKKQIVFTFVNIQRNLLKNKLHSFISNTRLKPNIYFGYFVRLNTHNESFSF